MLIYLHNSIIISNFAAYKQKVYSYDKRRVFKKAYRFKRKALSA